MAYKAKTVKNYKNKSTDKIHLSADTALIDFEDLIIMNDGEYDEYDSHELVPFALSTKKNQQVTAFQADFVLSRILEE